MMMHIVPPEVRRRRRRRRLALALAAGLTALGGGAMAAGGASERYVLVLVDARTGQVVSRNPAGDLRLPAGMRPDWDAAWDAAVRAAAGDLSDMFADIAEGRGRPPAVVAPAQPSTPKPQALAGGPVGRPDGLKIQIVDSWAAPGATPPPEEWNEEAVPG